MVSVKFKFEGLPSHASVSPHQGKSALDAVELMSVGVNFMREHVKEDTRIHYVITNGGGQPNVVPPSAEVWYYLRANKHTDVEEYFVWLTEIARAAAAMSRTKLIETRIDADLHEVLPNRTLAEVIQKNLELVGPPVFDEREKAFARATQKDLKPAAGAGACRARGAALERSADAGGALDRRRRSHVALPGRPVHGCHLLVRRARPQLADRRLHRHKHWRERDDGGRKDHCRIGHRSLCARPS